MSQHDLPKPVAPGEFREVFLIGVTGLVGRFMLRELLVQHRRLVVHCFVRARNAEGGLQRLRDRMKQADNWDEKFEPRIWVVVGDIGKACLGLSEKDFEYLC